MIANSVIDSVKSVTDALLSQVHIYFTEAQFKKVFPNSPQGLYHAISTQFGKAKCHTKAQQAMFLAQCGHETQGFTVFSENLNYSAERLLAVFPKYFSQKNVSLYARDKVKIANRIYANRMGNGDEKSGDGWKYRGRGIIQITGKDNYRTFAYATQNLEVIKNPDLVLSSLDFIVSTGVWYWNNRNLDKYSSVETVTRLINGGLNGIEDRRNLYNKLMSL